MMANLIEEVAFLYNRNLLDRNVAADILGFYVEPLWNASSSLVNEVRTKEAARRSSLSARNALTLLVAPNESPRETQTPRVAKVLAFAIGSASSSVVARSVCHDPASPTNNDRRVRVTMRVVEALSTFGCFCLALAKIASVPDLLHHLASFARFAAARGEREHHDADAMRELAGKPLELARGLELEWLGVAGYRLSYEGQTIYIDPYLSRVPLASVIRRTPALRRPVAARALPATVRDASSGCSSGTPTSTTRSTCPRSRAGMNAPPTARARWST